MAQLILGQSKSPKRRQSERCVMSSVRVHRRVVVSLGGVFYMKDFIFYPTPISRARSFGHTSIPSIARMTKHID